MKPTLSKALACAVMLGALALGGTAAVAQTAASPFELMKAELRITPAQEGMWKTYVSAYDANFVPSRNPSPQEFNAMTTPQRIELLKSLHREELNFITKRLDATVAMYNHLNADQKKLFDQMSATVPPEPARKAPAAGKKGKKK